MRQTVSATGAPAAVGSYSQAVKAGNLLFLSGQLCANPETGRFERESVAAQTRRIMENIKAIIEEAGGTLDAVVHCRAFLSDMKHFPEFESVYRSYFSAPYPARMTVASSTTSLLSSTQTRSGRAKNPSNIASLARSLTFNG